MTEDKRLLRRTHLGDVPTLTALIAASVRQLGSKDYSAEQLESGLKYIFGVDTQLIKDGTYYAVEVNNRMVACGGWSKRKTLFGGDEAVSREVDNLLDPKREAAKIRAFFVHPEYARQGIGSQIMQACEGAAKKEGFGKLELMATLTGEPLYAAFGFRVLERTQVDLPNGVKFPVTKMTKPLS